MHRDHDAALYWAEQGKQHSDDLVNACVETHHILYKHRSVEPKKKRAKLFGPIDLCGLNEKEAINIVEEEINSVSTRRQRSPRSIEQSFCILYSAQKASLQTFLHYDFLYIIMHQILKQNF